MTSRRVQVRPGRAGIPSKGTIQLSLLEPSDTPEGVADEPARGTTKRRPPRAPGGLVTCGWCGAKTPIPARGRVPKWCSAACRHRAWEQRRAAASGLCAVDVVERIVETVKVERIVQTQQVEVPVERRPQSVDDFAAVIVDLAHRLDSGRIYDRDLPTLDAPIGALLDALLRRRNYPRRASTGFAG